MSPTLESTNVSENDGDYDRMLIQMQDVFSTQIDGGRPLFTTEHPDLFDLYLKGIPDDKRQHYNCRTCRKFLNNFGGLVTINEGGHTSSAVWHMVNYSLMQPSVLRMKTAVERSKVSGVFISSESSYGVQKTGNWTHLALTPPASLVYRNILQTAFEASAEKKQDFITVSVALNEIRLDVLDQCLKLLTSEALYRSDKVLGAAQWLRDLKQAISGVEMFRRENIIWRAIATAPFGYCHPRSSMISTLIDDIERGMSFEQISRRFAEKMHGLNYQRPKADPTAGALLEAEKIFAKLGAVGSLDRRFLRHDEVKSFWKPAEKVVQAGSGAFGHLKAKNENVPVADLKMPPVIMTWKKFSTTILPNAESIEVYLTNERLPFCALLTAVNPDAPPILQWDLPEKRNPVSWYFWSDTRFGSGSMPAEFAMSGNSFAKVQMICARPSRWNDEQKCEHHGDGAILILEGARETRQEGNGLFPEIMKSEFHGIRSVISAYARSARIACMAEPHAAGLGIGKESGINLLLKVSVNGLVHQYKIDRWD